MMDFWKIVFANFIKDEDFLKNGIRKIAHILNDFLTKRLPLLLLFLGAGYVIFILLSLIFNGKFMPGLCVGTTKLELPSCKFKFS